MTEENKTPDPKSNKGCYLLIGKVIAFIVVIYILQWLLQIVFKAPDSDGIAAALKPYQNHFLSFSKYFVTTEASSGEFTDDMTGAGRFLSYMIFGGLLWFVLVVIFSLIKALKGSFDIIFWFITISITAIVFYWSFFVPYTKVVFTESDMVIERTDYIFSKKSVHIPFKSIEKIDYEFHEYKEVHAGHQLYSQIFATIGGKRILICENQVTIETSDASPTELQKQDTEKAIEAIQKLISKIN